MALSGILPNVPSVAESDGRGEPWRVYRWVAIIGCDPILKFYAGCTDKHRAIALARACDTRAFVLDGDGAEIYRNER